MNTETSESKIETNNTTSVVVNVSLDQTTENGQNSASNGQSQVSAKDRLLHALKTMPLPVSKRNKASPVTDALNEIKDVLYSMKMEKKYSIPQIHNLVNESGITCSVASLNTWFQDNQMVNKRKPKV